jgi:hypothetical protein
MAKASPWERIVIAALMLFAVGIIALSYKLEPDPRGYGTHQGLGFPPCGFMLYTGLPCPSCGMTTAFALAARLRFMDALLAQPMGLLVFFCVVLYIPVALVLVVLGIPVAEKIQERHLRWTALSLICGSLLSWIYKIVTVVSGRVGS